MIIEVAARLSESGPAWTAGELADALIAEGIGKESHAFSFGFRAALRCETNELRIDREAAEDRAWAEHLAWKERQSNGR